MTPIEQILAAITIHEPSGCWIYPVLLNTGRSQSPRALRHRLHRTTTGEPAMTIYYLTNRCLTDGIVEVDTDTDEKAGTHHQEPRTKLSGSGAAVYHFRKPEDRYSDTCIIGKEAFERREDAVADAEKRRQKRLDSLRKQIAKLESLTF